MENNHIKALAQKYGTPLYIYDRAEMEKNYALLKDSIFPGAKLFYSMKANPALGVCQVFRSMGSGIDAASAGELYTALEAGFDAGQILFTSPGKTWQEIEFALKHNIRRINVESLAEACMVDEAAAALGVKAQIGVRVNPAVCYSNAKIKMSGVASQFGIEEAELTKAFFGKLQSLKNLSVQGIQVYMGTQMLLAEDIIKNTEYTMDMAVRLSKEHGFALDYLNVGGGFGVQYFKNETPLDLGLLKAGMESLKERYGKELQNTEIIFESGRFLMAQAGVFVTEILHIKESKGQRFAVCDGGSNFHSSAAFLGRYIRNNFPMRAIPEGTETAECTVCGPLCTALDVIGQKVPLNKDLAPGDLVAIEKSGAYGYTYSPCKFLSHEQPVELMTDGSSEHVIRERTATEEILDGQKGIV